MSPDLFPPPHKEKRSGASCETINRLLNVNRDVGKQDCQGSVEVVASTEAEEIHGYGKIIKPLLC